MEKIKYCYRDGSVVVKKYEPNRIFKYLDDKEFENTFKIGTIELINVDDMFDKRNFKIK